MRPGKLDRRLTLYRLETEQDEDSGQEKKTYVRVGTFWASWNPLKGSRRWEAMQHVERAAGWFEIRYRKGITPLHEVECEGTRYTIQGVPEEIGRREGLRIHVSARYQGDGC